MAAQRSLEKLQSSHIDLYQVHWPSPRVPIEEAMREAEEALSRHELASSQWSTTLR